MKKLLLAAVLGMAALASQRAVAISPANSNVQLYSVPQARPNTSGQVSASVVVDSLLQAFKIMETDVVLSATPVSVSATTGANSQAVVLPSGTRWVFVEVRGKTATSFVECSVNTDDQGRGGGVKYRQDQVPFRQYLKPSSLGTTLYLNVTGVTASAPAEQVTVVYGTK